MSAIRKEMIRGHLDTLFKSLGKNHKQVKEDLLKRVLESQEPRARGYLRARDGYRLFEKRGELCGRLTADVRKNKEWLVETLRYPLAGAMLKSG